MRFSYNIIYIYHVRGRVPTHNGTLEIYLQISSGQWEFRYILGHLRGVFALYSYILYTAVATGGSLTWPPGTHNSTGGVCSAQRLYAPKIYRQAFRDLDSGCTLFEFAKP